MAEKGRKGGLNRWKKMSEEERRRAVQKMIKGRNKQRLARRMQRERERGGNHENG